MMIGPTISVMHNNAEHIIKTEFHPITNCLSKREAFYELRTYVTNAKKQLCSQTFFQEFNSQSAYQFFRECFVLARNLALGKVLINVHFRFLSTKFVDFLLLKFDDLKLVFKICENRNLHDINLLRERIETVKEHPNASVWLDGFGSKMVNFDVIKDISFDGITICKEVFWDLYHYDTGVLHHLINTLKIKTVLLAIEGVDCYDKYSFCKQNDCFMSGDYLIDRPETF